MLRRNGVEGQALLRQMQEESNGRVGFLVVIAGATVSEFEYRKGVLAQILEETGGEFLSHFEDPDVKREVLWSETRFSGGVREGFRPTGRFHGLIGDTAMFQTSMRYMLDCMDLQLAVQARGNVRTDGGTDYVIGMVFENGHNGHAEQLVMTHPTAEGWRDLMQFSDDCEDLGIEKGYTVPATVFGDRGHDKWGPILGNYHLWLRKIKKSFDPNGVSEAATYISAKD